MSETELAYVIAANVRGPEGRGIKHFREGAKVIIAGTNPGSGAEQLEVVGLHRGKGRKRRTCIWVKGKWLTNVRPVQMPTGKAAGAIAFGSKAEAEVRAAGLAQAFAGYYERWLAGGGLVVREYVIHEAKQNEQRVCLPVLAADDVTPGALEGAFAAACKMMGCRPAQVRSSGVSWGPATVSVQKGPRPHEGREVHEVASAGVLHFAGPPAKPQGLPRARREPPWRFTVERRVAA